MGRILNEMGNMPVRVVVDGVAYGLRDAFIIRDGRCFFIVDTPAQKRVPNLLKRAINMAKKTSIQ
jgi:hypothetical protein